ncbi:FAD-binding and (Fe-S)-binding domain-containing protein [Pelistega europaea]|uniref:D-2-hydroxyglutarate dehydrogenase n=1 Tax=Pelistega europaea TaxID=106147 RepID=A0A7Y4P4Y9_9BURK|nr:FAD-binding and (Fe-S)-binding domain-containing protein [Pelistega europaea]NOL49981.1 FAD-binding oxidoreductase [Pelistega europaea]
MNQVTQRFLDTLCTHFEGDIDSSDAARQVFSTDNSIYQREPQAVVYPKNTQDLIHIATLMQQEEFRQVVITPRGGGTGTNGQSLTDGIIVDISRHMNRILHIDPVKRTARVQAGVVKDQLNAALAPYGLFFAPELSTSNRATIGGMISTDASGQGSCRYGKTHHHVLELSTVLIGGEVLDSKPLSRNNWESEISDKSEHQQALYRQLFQLAQDNQEIIKRSFPVLNRSLTGYDLPNLLTEDTFNINNILCGSEGSLGFLTEATLNVLPIPKHNLLINIGYTDFQAALRDAKALMALDPLSIETVDSKVLGLAKQDIVWQNVARYFPETEVPTQGINLVELNADDPATLQQLKEAFLDHLKNDNSVQRLSITVAEGSTEVKHVYAMRKRSVGLLGNVQGEKRPQPFVEDTAVPPENLADYIAEFRHLLDSMGLDYGMFGHVDAGVLHVRPLIDMKDDSAEQIIRKVSDKVVELTHRYGGVIWGEHGKGLRSGYAPTFFGAAYPLVQKVKGLFDTRNQLNPGKIATPDTIPTAKLIDLTAIDFRGKRDKQVSPKDWTEFGSMMHCNGNGACFNYDLDDPMCPSYKVTRNRIHSPKGRATLIKEWLRRETVQQNSDTFDKEVYEALHGCLSCKSCAGQCPVKVDIPDSKARFLERFHTKHPRQRRDSALANLEKLLPYIAKAPSLYNTLQANAWVQKIQREYFGLVASPSLHPSCNLRWSDYGAILLNRDLSNLPAKATGVVLVQDAFTRYFDTDLWIALLRFLAKLGVQAYVLPYFPNGKPLHVHGYLAEFEAQRAKNEVILSQIQARGLPLVGVDPAVTLTYRQEYRRHYGHIEPKGNFHVQLLQEWLTDWIKDKSAHAMTQQEYYLAAHCTEKTQVPAAPKQWQEVFAHFGLNLKVLNLGCCGMAGTYGHEAEHRSQSEKLYQMSWAEKSRQHQDKMLATGYSCRSQVKLVEQRRMKHPIEVLADILP